MEITRLVIADVERLFTEGITCIINRHPELNISIAGLARSAEDIFELVENQSVDIIFMELNLPDENGLSVIPRLRKQFPDLKICVMSSYTDFKFVKEALQNGADGYYSKLNSSDELSQCVLDLLEGKTFISKGLHITPPPRRLQNGNNGGHKIEDRFLIRQKLTKREHEVLGLIAKAMNNKEIAGELYISDQTVGVHRKNIMRKLGVRNTVNLIKFALDHQLV